MGGSHREAGLNFTKTSLPSCPPWQELYKKAAKPKHKAQTHYLLCRLRFQNSFLCMLVLFSVFLPEGSLTWARWPGPGYTSLSALPEETVGLLARDLGRPAPDSVHSRRSDAGSVKGLELRKRPEQSALSRREWGGGTCCSSEALRMSEGPC